MGRVLNSQSYLKNYHIVQKRMGHKMTHIDGVPAVLGGYNDDLITSVEFLENGTWRIGSQHLEFGR